METLIMYLIPRSIMHDQLPHHVAHHFVTFSLGRLLLLIALTKFTPPLPPLYASCHYTLICMLPPPLFAPLMPACSVANTDRP